MSKPIALRAFSGASSSEVATRSAFAPRSGAVRLTLVAATCCMVGLVCAPRAVAADMPLKKSSTQHIATRAKAVAPVIPELDPTLLEPASAPDCAFRGTMGNPATVEETRMKLDYEAQCYRQAEGIVRARLQRLQDAARR
jgi:hypothetical protein